MAPEPGHPNYAAFRHPPSPQAPTRRNATWRIPGRQGPPLSTSASSIHCTGGGSPYALVIGGFRSRQGDAGRAPAPVGGRHDAWRRRHPRTARQRRRWSACFLRQSDLTVLGDVSSATVATSGMTRGTISLVASGCFIGRDRSGVRRIRTPVSRSEATLTDSSRASLRNGASYATRHGWRQIARHQPGQRNDIAWGNCFVLPVNSTKLDTTGASRRRDLPSPLRHARPAGSWKTRASRRRGRRLRQSSGCSPTIPTLDSRNFVLCQQDLRPTRPPGSTSAKARPAWPPTATAAQPVT